MYSWIILIVWLSITIYKSNIVCRNAQHFNKTTEVDVFMVHDDRVASGHTGEASNWPLLFPLPSYTSALFHAAIPFVVKSYHEYTSDTF